jgi:steroid 5-alpha reductase family enzyme|tara:strand:- start:11720 stop:12565 length:846 start_codon:yes stop_codon:yes gene_type:complete
MKNHLFNILSSIIAFYIPFQIALLTDLPLVKNLILLIFSIQWISFIPAYIFQTEKFFDLTGSMTYLTTVLAALYITDSVKISDYVIVSCVVIWAIRLGSFLFMRIHKAGEDRRFREIKTNFTRFFMTWTLQGMWVSMCLLCLITALSSYSGIILNNVFYIGLLIFIFGFIIEVVADHQKTVFRKDLKNKDKFISTGLWSYSRHPNYLGEILLWFGVAIMSFSSLQGLQYLTLISPIFVYILLVYISGIRILENQGDKKWGHLDSYKEYLKNTPMLFFRIFG